LNEGKVGESQAFRCSRGVECDGEKWTSTVGQVGELPSLRRKKVFLVQLSPVSLSMVPFPLYIKIL